MFGKLDDAELAVLSAAVIRALRKNADLTREISFLDPRPSLMRARARMIRQRIGVLEDLAGLADEITLEWIAA